MFKRKTTLSYDESRISRIDFGKHPHTISLRRITVSVLVGFTVVMLLVIGLV